MHPLVGAADRLKATEGCLVVPIAHFLFCMMTHAEPPGSEIKPELQQGLSWTDLVQVFKGQVALALNGMIQFFIQQVPE